MVVLGRGVVGQEPALTKSLPAFQYSSHVSLQAPSGHMWWVLFILSFNWKLILVCFRGTFRMEREDGYTFDCRIPPFSLESKPEGGSATPPETVWDLIYLTLYIFNTSFTKLKKTSKIVCKYQRHIIIINNWCIDLKSF